MGCDVTTKVGTKHAVIKADPLVYLGQFWGPIVWYHVASRTPIVKVLKLGTSCTTMDGLRYWQYHHSKNKTIQHLPPISRKTGQWHKLLSKSLLKACCVYDWTVCLICVSVLLMIVIILCDKCMCLRCCGWKKKYFQSECVITIYLSKCINHVTILLVQYHNILWVLYLDCTSGYLQFDMLVAIVSVRNNETSLFRTGSAEN